MFQPNYPSLCIPRVFPNISEQKIRKVFEGNNFGALSRIDMVLKTNERGEKYYRVFIHFHEWNNHENIFNTRLRLINGEELQIYYNQKYFWKVSAYREKNVSQMAYPMQPAYNVYSPQPLYLPPLHLLRPPQPPLPPMPQPPLPLMPQPPVYLPPLQVPLPPMPPKRRPHHQPTVHKPRSYGNQVKFRLVDEVKEHVQVLHSPPPPPSSPLSPPPLSPRSPVSPPPIQEEEIKYKSNFIDPDEDETLQYENWQIDYKNTAVPKRRITRNKNK